jgi:hypothetical protein
MQLKGRAAARAVFLGVALTAAAIIVFVSLDRDAYFFYWEEDRVKWTYPMTGVILVVSLVFAETAFAYWVFTAHRPRSFWLRAMAGLVVLAVWGSLLLVPIIHSPGFYMFHLLYVWLLTAAVALALMAFLAHHGMHRLRARLAKQM